MNSFFEKMFLPDEFLRYYNDGLLNIVYSVSKETRSDNTSFFKRLQDKCVCTTFPIEYVYDEDAFYYSGVRYNIKQDIELFLNSIDTETPLLIDITTMNLRLLGTFLAKIKKLSFPSVYCLYTEPGRYSKNTDSAENIDRFDLYRKFKGIEAIPGFLRANDRGLNVKCIAFLGFDGKRIEQLREKYEFQDMVPVVTLPSFKPGWHNYALHENLDTIKNIDRKPEYIIANSYLSAYNYLDRVQTSSPNTYIRVIPFGTKINCLGILLYVLNHKEGIDIIYDNPIEEGRISDERGNTYIFDISEIINAS